MEKNKRLIPFMSTVYGKGFILVLLEILLCAASTSMAQFFITYYLGVIIDSVDSGYQTVIKYFIYISAAVVFNVAGNASWIFLSGRTVNKFTGNIRKLIGNKLCSAEYEGIEKIKDGELLSIVTNDTECFRTWFTSLSSIGFIPVKLVFVLVFIVFINWKLALMMIPVLPLAMIPSVFLSKKLYSLNTAERESAGKVTGFLSSTIDFIIVLKSFCLEKVFLIKNRKVLLEAEKTRMRRTLREQIIQTQGRCVGNITTPLFYIAGAYFILGGEMTIGQMVTIMLYAGMVGEAINIIAVMPSNYQAAKAAMKRVKKILDQKEEKTGKSDNVNLSGDTVFETRDLSFSYDGDPVLKNVGFSIRKGEKIAVVGMSGSGKTTLFKLLCGLYRPESGKILYHGADTLDIPVETLRENMSVVPQDSFLFSDTIKNNIGVAKPGAGNEEITEACRKAYIHEFIKSLDDGYETKLIDANRSMSKGQMQRINLARAFLRDTGVYLFDEPTSALDIKTHEAVMDGILDESWNKTAVVIIHTLTEPWRFDRILVMKNGEISGFDSHKNLLKENEDYSAILSRSGSEGE